MTEAFVYCWTNTENNKLYVGWHKGSPDDGYVCSSKYMKEDYIKNPNVFVRQIIAEGTTDDMIALESALLDAANAKDDDSYYNMSNGRTGWYVREKTEEHKKNISKSNIGKHSKSLSVEHKEKIRTKMKERVLSEDHKKKIGEKTKARHLRGEMSMLYSPENRKKALLSRVVNPPDENARFAMGASNRGKILDDTRRRNMSNAAKSRWSKIPKENRIPWNKGKNKDNTL